MKKFSKALSDSFSFGRLLSAGLFLSISSMVAADDLPLSETRLADLGPEAFFQLGQEVTGQVCTMCHGWDMVLSTRQTPTQWNFTVSDMVARGASATAEQQEFIVRFMSWAWGQVAVNSASVEDLVAVIGLSEGQAQAMVAYREEHGPFSDLAGLKQVPGIDVAALDQQADALLFN